MYLVRVVDEDPVRPGEHPLPPGIDELAVLVEHDEGVLAAAEDIDPIAGVGRNPRHLRERPAFGKAFPAFRHLELEPVVPLGHVHFLICRPDCGPHYASSQAARDPGRGRRVSQAPTRIPEARCATSAATAASPTTSQGGQRSRKSRAKAPSTQTKSAAPRTLPVNTGS